MKIITLLTDFGLIDGYPGIMKGVIYGIAPDVQIADITHLISPQNVREGALAISRSYRYFPSGTIHVAVVDPGVGTTRRPIAAQIGNHTFIGPDNGLFSYVLAEAEQAQFHVKVYHLNNKDFWLPSVSNVFHGRDIFAPVAAHLAAGVSLAETGPLVIDPLIFPIPQPIQTKTGWSGEVVAVDHFGNLSTNIMSDHLVGLVNPNVTIAGQRITGIVNTFGDRPSGTLVALIGTDHDLSIAVVNGNALDHLQVGIGSKVEVIES